MTGRNTAMRWVSNVAGRPPDHLDACLDLALELTFPASDPVAVCMERSTHPGIRPEEREHVFSKFMRDWAHTQTHDRGAGVGSGGAGQLSK